jgi:hypothetical protein
MKRVPIERIAIDGTGRLMVCPGPEGQRSYDLIYREANGLRWDRNERALVAYEPGRWEHAELLAHIVSTLRDACDEALVLTDKSRLDVPPGEEQALRAVFGGQPNAI